MEASEEKLGLKHLEPEAGLKVMQVLASAVEERILTLTLLVAVHEAVRMPVTIRALRPLPTLRRGWTT